MSENPTTRTVDDVLREMDKWQADHGGQFPFRDVAILRTEIERLRDALRSPDPPLNPWRLFCAWLRLSDRWISARVRRASSNGQS